MCVNLLIAYVKVRPDLIDVSGRSSVSQQELLQLRHRRRFIWWIPERHAEAHTQWWHNIFIVLDKSIENFCGEKIFKGKCKEVKAEYRKMSWCDSFTIMCLCYIISSLLMHRFSWGEADLLLICLGVQKMTISIIFWLFSPLNDFVCKISENSKKYHHCKTSDDVFVTLSDQ